MPHGRSNDRTAVPCLAPSSYGARIGQGNSSSRKELTMSKPKSHLPPSTTRRNPAARSAAPAAKPGLVALSLNQGNGFPSIVLASEDVFGRVFPKNGGFSTAEQRTTAVRLIEDASQVFDEVRAAGVAAFSHRLLISSSELRQVELAFCLADLCAGLVARTAGRGGDAETISSARNELGALLKEAGLMPRKSIILACAPIPVPGAQAGLLIAHPDEMPQLLQAVGTACSA
jgi:hypothetical protein